jgi:hypothetical protein
VLPDSRIPLQVVKFKAKSGVAEFLIVGSGIYHFALATLLVNKTVPASRLV